VLVLKGLKNCVQADRMLQIVAPDRGGAGRQ
jgi:hypothetical protein